MQRLPGITVNRLQSNDDSTHPSGEPTNILIRGLTQVLTQFNGRDTFSADSGRGLNFNDVSPELLSRVDTYKNQTADMIEGGIAGTVNLRTRLPFDQDGHVLVGQAQGNYGDRAKQATPHQMHSATAAPHQTSPRAIAKPALLARQIPSPPRADHTQSTHHKRSDLDKYPPHKAVPRSQYARPQTSLAPRAAPATP